jgi:hypothetical protein
LHVPCSAARACEKIKIIKNAPPVSPNADYVDYAFIMFEMAQTEGYRLGEMKIIFRRGEPCASMLQWPDSW